MFASNVYTINACAWHSRVQCWKKREKNMVVVYWYKFWGSLSTKLKTMHCESWETTDQIESNYFILSFAFL